MTLVSIMLVAAAAGDGPSLGMVVALGLLGWAGVYALQCWWFPLAACRRCEGGGKLKNRRGLHGRICPRCKGNSWRTRWGRRLFDTTTGRGGI